MGQIRTILKRRQVPRPILNNRLTVELCENVHLHYRNLRLEFPHEEFLFLLRHLKSIDEREVEAFAYRKDAFQAIVQTEELPPATEFDDRLQIEEQVQGHFHVHYRNLRVEMNDLHEIGLEGCAPIDRAYLDRLGKGSEEVEGTVKECKLSDLRALLFDPETRQFGPAPLETTPHLGFLRGEERPYRQYLEGIREHLSADVSHGPERFRELEQSITTQGYLENCLIVVRGREIWDGLHRAAILHHLHGKDHVLPVFSLDGSSRASSELKRTREELRLLAHQLEVLTNSRTWRWAQAQKRVFKWAVSLVRFPGEALRRCLRAWKGETKQAPVAHARVNRAA